MTEAPGQTVDPRAALETARSRILVVDDERAIRRLLVRYLEQAGLSAVEAADGEHGLQVLRQGGADLALVDVMLPGLDGFELVRRARRFSDIPILLVTARGEERHRVSGLELGADDYVVKPFSAPEVVARVRAHLRRRTGVADPSGSGPTGGSGLVLDAGSRRCLLDGDEVELTRREFDLLAVLRDHPGRVLNRVQLLELAWGTTHVIEKTVDVHMASLRRKLGPALRVSTIRGIGYRSEP